MQLTDPELKNFVNRIRLQTGSMDKYREQVKNLREKLEKKIKEDESNSIKVTKFLIAGSWKKHTILRPTGTNPIDLDLVLFITGDDSFKTEVEKLHDFVVAYLEAIYPTKDIARDVDAEGRTKAITIKFIGTGLQVDIVPVVPLATPVGYVWQPERGGLGRYVTSIQGQLDASLAWRKRNEVYTRVVRALKWWRNYQELDLLSSFVIELLVAYLDDQEGLSATTEEGIIRFFRFVSDPEFPVISFAGAINMVPSFTTPVFVADPTNNENNAASKMTKVAWEEVVTKAAEAYDALYIARRRGSAGATQEEWKAVFGPSFNIDELT